MRYLLPCFTAVFLLLAARPGAAQQYQYDNAGRLTAALYPGGGSIRYEYDANGNITRVQYASGKVAALPPDGVIDTPAGDVTIQAGQSVNFTGTGTDPDGATPLTYLWEFDGAAADSNDEDPGDVVFPAAGSYTVEFTVTDATNLADPTPDSVVVTVTAAPGGNTGGGGSGGAGSLLWLPFICAAFWLARRSRMLVLAALVLASGAQAQTWSQMNSPTDQTLNDVWAAASDDAWAVGDAGTVLHYDGTSWEIVDVGTTSRLTAIWGVSFNDIMIVGDGGLVLRYDGSNWTGIDIGAGTMNLTDVWYTAGGTRYVIGVRGAWFDAGGGWIRQTFNTFHDGVTLTPTYTLSAVRASDNHVVITSNTSLGGRGGLFVDQEQVEIWSGESLWVFDDAHMFFSGDNVRRLDGGDPTVGADWIRELGGGGGGNDIWAVSPDDIYVAAELSTYGIIYHYDGSAWTQDVVVNFRKFYGIHGPNERTVFAVGALGAIYAYREPPPTPTAANFPYAGVTEGNVNVHTGELVHETTDFSIGSDPLEFRRYYASSLWSQGTVGGALGENWTHNYEWRIDAGFGANGNQVRVTDYRGTEFVFDVGATSATPVSPAWADVSLSEDSDRYFFADHDTNRIHAFSKQNGNLQWIEDRNGNRHTLAYNQGFLVSVSNGKDNIIRFEYTPSGRMARAWVPEGSLELEAAFTYAGGLLTGSTLPGDVQTGYTYDGGALLTAIEVAGAVEKEWDYGSRDRVIATTYTEGGSFIYTYDGNEMSISEPGASIRTYVHDADGRLVSLTNGVGAIETWGYDGEGRRNAYTDAAGRTTSWSYDAVHRKMVSVTVPGGHTTAIDYQVGSSAMGLPFYDIESITHPDGAFESFEYDARGNVIAYTDPEGGRWDYTYDAAGNLVEAVNPAGGPTTFTRTADGRVSTVTDPENNVTAYGYDPFQRRTSVTYADSSEATLEYSTRFTPDRVTLRSGATYDYTYDAGNRVTRIDRSDGYFEIYGYDTAGSIITRTLPGNRTTAYRYDARRNVDRIVAPDLGFELFGYDTADRLTQYVDADGRNWQFEYAVDGALTAVVRPGGERFEYEYDADPRGLLSSVTNGTETTTFGYDSRGRLATATDPLERTNAISRNALGDIERIVTSPSNATRTYEYDPLGNVVRFTTPGGGAYGRVFGADGLLDVETDPLGNSTRYSRDALNRVEQVEQADNSTIDISYAPSGLPAALTGSDGSDVAIDSTPEGYIVGGTGLSLQRTPTGRVSDSNGIAVEHDARDRIESMTLMPGMVVEYEFNGRGDAVAVRDWLGGETSLSYTDTGRVATITYPNGVAAGYSYDSAERISGIDFGAIGSIVLDRNADGRLESAIRNLPGPGELPDEDRQFSYDAASQRVGASYDLRGNLLADGQRSWRYDGLNRLTGIADGSRMMELEHDALGNLVGIRGAQDRSLVVNYALDEPRVSIDLDSAGDVVWFSVHTPDGRLLYRINAAGERQYHHFDEAGNTAFLTDDSAAVIGSYLVAPHGEVVDYSGTYTDLIVGAEFGGRNLGESQTWVIGARYNDSFAGQYLTGHSATPRTADDAALEFSGSFGRSVSVGETDTLRDRSPAVSLRDLFAGRQTFDQHLARVYGTRTIEESVQDVYEGLGLTPSAGDEAAATEVDARVAEWRRNFVRRGRGKPADDRDNSVGLTHNILALFVLIALADAAAGPQPETASPEAVDSILKEVGSKLILD